MSDVARAVVPALRVEAAMLDELKAEAKALDVPLATYHRRLLEARAIGATELQPRAKPDRDVVHDLTTPGDGRYVFDPPQPAGPRQCACPRPRPKATPYGLCTGCAGRR